MHTALAETSQHVYGLFMAVDVNKGLILLYLLSVISSHTPVHVSPQVNISRQPELLQLYM